MFRERIKFVQAFGKLAKIEGSAECSDSEIKFELAMTDSPNGRVKGVLKRAVSYADLEDVQLRRRIFRKPSLTFSARSLETFNSIPGAKGFSYVVDIAGSARDARLFVTDARLAIAEAAMNRFTDQIEDTVD